MLPIEDALFKILQQVPDVFCETISILESEGRVLQEDIFSPWDMPAFSNSAMDGYAVRVEDVANATLEQPISLKVTQEIPASGWSEQWLRAGESARIFTGAAIPPGCDAVDPQENVTRDGDLVIFTAPVPFGKSIRRQGEYLKKGEPLLRKGQPIGAGEIGLLASIGRLSVTVTRQPRIAVLSCGDELVEPHATPNPGQIYESNRYALYTQIKQAGGVPLLLPLVPDDEEQILAQVKAGLQADIFISSGGVSVGDYDLVRPALEQMGVSIEFWKIAMKPGKPVVFGRKDDCLFFGLPGNPGSSMVTFELCVRPVIRRMLGFENIHRAKVKARLTASVRPAKGRTHFVRGFLKWVGDEYLFTAYRSQSSGDLMSMHHIDSYAILDPGTDMVSAGSLVDVIDLSPRWNGRPKWQDDAR